MRRREAVSAAVFASLVTMVPRAARAQAAPEKLRVAAVTAEDLTGLYYAVKTGMFGRVGLDVEMVPVANGSAATTAVITGTYELARSSLIAILSAHLRGIPVTIVAPSIVSTQRNPNSVLQIAADAPYKTGADLNGKTIASAGLGDLNSLSARAWVDANGGDSRTLKFVEIPLVALEAALVSHRVDAAVMGSPQLDASLAAGTTKTLGLSYVAIGPAVMSAAYVARGDWVAQHTDTLRKFTRVLAEANTYVGAHPAETLPLVAELTKIPLANSERMHRTLNATQLDPALVQPIIDVAAKYEVLSRAFPAREILWSGK
jgi:NitT/TauT family transport system substrate-binding protein